MTQISGLPLPLVLHVDDEPQAGKWFARAFSMEWEIVTATGVDQALDMLLQPDSRIAVVVTDFRMPGRNGSDLIREIQRLPRCVLTILATACPDSSTLISAVNAGHLFRIIQKPYDPEETIRALRDAIAAWKMASR